MSIETFEILLSNLEKEVELGNIGKSICPYGDFVLYDYTNQCQFDKNWNETTNMARGLILDLQNKCLANRVLPKFHNLSEYGPDWNPPEHPFVVTEKYDGSMISLWFDKQSCLWRCTTRGSFSSEQAQWASSHISRYNLNTLLNRDISYIFEAIYPQNRIVVDYKGLESLVLIAAFDQESGQELDIHNSDKFPFAAYHPHTQISRIYHINNLVELIEMSKNIDYNQEGWVIRYSNGFRLKIKGDDYSRVHKVKSNVTPLGVWEIMMGEMPLEEVLSGLPDEFYDEAFGLSRIFDCQVENVYRMATLAYVDLTSKFTTRKDIAINGKLKYPDLMGYVFKMLDNVSDKELRQIILKGLRPTGNKI